MSATITEQSLSVVNNSLALHFPIIDIFWAEKKEKKSVLISEMS